MGYELIVSERSLILRSKRFALTEDKEKKELYLDLDPNYSGPRVGPPDKKRGGFMGKESLCQPEMHPVTTQMIGLKVIFEIGRDDSEYELGK